MQSLSIVGDEAQLESIGHVTAQALPSFKEKGDKGLSVSNFASSKEISFLKLSNEDGWFDAIVIN